MKKLLEKTKFKQIQIYDDSNYPGKEKIDSDIFYGIDPLPAKVKRFKQNLSPSIPPKEILDQNNGYNWIAIARK